VSAPDASFTVHDEALPDGSGVRRESHTPFCEGPKVKFLRPTLLLIFNEAHLRRAISRYAAYFNYWRPHRSLGQRAPCESTVHQFRPEGPSARSRPSTSWVDCITTIGVLHDGLYFCTPNLAVDHECFYPVQM
jgi:hypothetical protein